MSYGHAEITLTMERAGRCYDRLEKAEREAAWTLIGHLDRRNPERWRIPAAPRITL